MAETTELKAAAERIDLDLDALEEEVADLPDLAETWDDESDAMRYSERLTWLSCMGVLDRRVDPAFRSGKMTPDQQTRYRELVRKLRDARPVLGRLGFDLPKASLDCAA